MEGTGHSDYGRTLIIVREGDVVIMEMGLRYCDKGLDICDKGLNYYGY